MRSFDRFANRSTSTSTRWIPFRGERERSSEAIERKSSRQAEGNRETRSGVRCVSDKRSGWTRGCFVLSKRRNSHPRNWTFNVRLKAFWLAYTPLPKEEEQVESAPFARGRGSRASRNEKSPAKNSRTLPKIYTRCVGKIPGPNEKPGIDFPADPRTTYRCESVKLASDTAFGSTERKEDENVEKWNDDT